MQVKAFQIFIYTALPSEAKPIVDYFRLKKDTQVNPFAVYANQNIRLTVTGIGKNAMAAGIAYTQALFSGGENSVILNLGIAGHRNHDVGSVFVAHKITDVDAQKRYYPPQLSRWPCPSENLMTAAQPQLEYQHDELCDMEASAFYETATRFALAELCQSIKVVSDNKSAPAENINPQLVCSLIARQLPTLVEVMEELRKIAEPLVLSEIGQTGGWEGRYRFTASQKISLQKKLRRWNVLADNRMLPVEVSAGGNAKALLDWLEAQIDGEAFYL